MIYKNIKCTLILCLTFILILSGCKKTSNTTENNNLAFDGPTINDEYDIASNNICCNCGYQLTEDDNGDLCNTCTELPVYKLFFNAIDNWESRTVN